MEAASSVSAVLVLVAVALYAVSGLPPLLARRRSRVADGVAAFLAGLGSLSGLWGAALAVLGHGGPPLRRAWGIPGAALLVKVDGLSALFLVPLLIVAGLGSLYACAYWSPAHHPRTAPRLRLAFGVTTAALALVFVARNAILFLVSWEVMALGCFVMVVTEAKRPEVRAAGWVYLVATHTGTLALIALFGILAAVSGGSLELAPMPAGLAKSATGSAIFWLTLAGFGVKAGLMPLHVWLPGAHAGAPSHVSALMSGVVLKAGVYGIVRVLTLFPDPPLLWGAVVLGLGAVSAILGVAYALGQHDLKRLLAYHSIENVGIITIGIGLALAGRALRRPGWELLGLAGGLLHVVNHALFKSLLFLGAGSVLHRTGTREMDRMGGLLKVLPRTGAAFLVGAVAICGLPPLNGLVSEWLVYLGLFRASAEPGAFSVAAAVAVAGLALVGGLALACFVKAFGVVFLGLPRGEAPREGHENLAMTVPMAALAFLCFLIGLAPSAVAPLLDAATRAAGTRGRILSMASLGDLGAANAAVLAAVVASAALLSWRTKRRPVALASAAAVPTWDCGYARPTARMQYTASSLAGWNVGFFRWALLPKAETSRPRGPFPEGAHFHEHVPDLVLDRVLLPGARSLAWLLSFVRILQGGHMQLYLVYAVVTLLVLLSLV